MADLEFRVLGPLEVFREGQPVQLPPGRPRALLGRLLLNANTAVATDRLIEDLWAGDPPLSALHALQVYVSNLRRLLEPGRAPGLSPQVLVTRAPGYLLAAEPERTDSGRFERLVACGSRALGSGQAPEASRLFAEALGLWRGAVLADLADEPFVSTEASRLDELRAVAADRWAEAELALGRHTDLVGELESLVRLHPFREGLWAKLIVALYRSGRQADALHTYQRLRLLLAEELGLEPSPPLRQLEAAILRHDPDLAVPAATAGSGAVGPVAENAPRRPLVERTPFVGRKSEQAELHGLMEQTKAGHGALLMVGGEPGVGKSRLADELRRRCNASGFATFVGHCYESAGAPPYVPVVEVFEQALAEAPSPKAFCDFLGGEAPEIAKLVPKLRQLCPDLPAPLDLPAEQERRYLFNAVFEVLARTAAAKPTLLVLDDIHWADEPTLLLVSHIAERLAGIRVLVVGLYRDNELDVGRPLSYTFAELIRRRLARPMRLERLPGEGVAEMLAGLAAGQRPPARLVEVVYAAGEGNPFFSEEVFKHLAEEGRLFDGDGRFRSDLSADELDVPESVRMVVGARLRRLGDVGSRVLGMAAVLGRVFTFELLAALEELPEEQLLDVVEAAERARLIGTVRDPSGGEAYLFSHELIRQTVLSELSAPRRQRLHARAAQALERLNPENRAEQAATIAHHLLEAGSAAQPEQTFRYLALAGETAMGSAAYEDALHYFEGAGAMKHFATPRETADLLYWLGQTQRSLGRWDDAIKTSRAALDAYALLGEREEEGRLCWELAWQLNWEGRWADSMETAQRGLASLGDRESPARVGLLGVVGVVLGFTNQYQAARGMIDEALVLADRVGDRLSLGQALAIADAFNWAFSRFEEAVESGRRASPLLQEHGALWDEVLASLWVQLSLHALGRWDEAAELFERVQPLAVRLGHQFAELVSRRERAARERNRCADLDRYEEFARADLELNRITGMAWIGQSYIFLALLDFWRGRWPEAVANIREGSRLESTGVISLWSPALHMLITAYAGDRDGALAVFRERSGELPVPGQQAVIGAWQFLFSAVEALAVLGEREETAGLYPLILEAIAAGTVVDGYIHGRLVQMLAGIAAGADGRWKEAEHHYRTALDQATALGQRMERPDILRFYASMLLERRGPGDEEQARAQLEEAIAAYRTMEMPRHEAMAAQLLVNAELRPGRRRPSR